MKVSVILGTRPEAIKLAPVVLALKADPRFQCHVCSTGQHRQMLDQVLGVFNVLPDVDLNLMAPNQTLASLTARALTALDGYLQEENPDAVIVQGDTTTVFAGALAAFYHKIPIAHVEAGLRTWNLLSPWPEEANRVLTTRLAHWHFTPTESNKENLLAEGVDSSRIFVTGNTVIDALHIASAKVETIAPEIDGLPGKSLDCLGNRRMVLITGHRRENFGGGFEQICHAIKRLVQEHPDVDFVYPVHMNPNVRGPVEDLLGAMGKAKWPNLHLINPQSYLAFIALMKRAFLILTDSGGVQEEGPSLGKPVLVMRDTTERPEAVRAGSVRLVGADKRQIINSVEKLLGDDGLYKAMVPKSNPYGDGHAAKRILEGLLG